MGEIKEKINPEEIISENPKTIEEAIKYIDAMRSWTGIKANNDKEYNKFREIEEDLRSGRETPEGAKVRAFKVMNDKHVG